MSPPGRPNAGSCQNGDESTILPHLEMLQEVVAAGTALGRGQISSNIPAAGIRPIQCIITAWKPLFQASCLDVQVP